MQRNLAPLPEDGAPENINLPLPEFDENQDQSSNVSLLVPQTINLPSPDTGVLQLQEVFSDHDSDMFATSMIGSFCPLYGASYWKYRVLLEISVILPTGFFNSLTTVRMQS